MFEDKPYELYKGDCLEVMKDIPSGSVDMILCDLPYGTTRNKWDIIISFERLWEQYERVVCDSGAIVLFGSEPFSTLVRASRLELYKYDLVWIKNRPTGFVHAKNKPLKKHENLMIFSKGKIDHASKCNRRMNYFPQGVEDNGSAKILASRHGNLLKNYENQIGKEYNSKKNFPNDILNFPTPSNSERLHPTQKPVELLEWLVGTYTNEEMVVLDNTMGSGSTGVACINTNRKFIGIELDDTYYEISEKRISEALQNKGF